MGIVRRIILIGRRRGEKGLVLCESISSKVFYARNVLLALVAMFNLV